jgi:AraC family transcriptional regulator
MRVNFERRGLVDEPYIRVHEEHGLAMQLRQGSMEVGLQRSSIRLVSFPAGEMGLCAPNVERWIGNADMEHVTVSISDAALMAVSDTESGKVKLSPQFKLVDPLLSSLVSAVNTERLAGFPNGQLFLDSVEQALAVALVNRYAAQQAVRRYRAGLPPARLRRVIELIEARIEDDLSLEEMAESVNLSTAHFSHMFRSSTGQSPYMFVLRRRVDRAKEMLRNSDFRVLDVAVGCGFKTQQHFARVFRQLSGLSPSEYRHEFIR